jgi:hypothetical protein
MRNIYVSKCVPLIRGEDYNTMRKKPLRETLRALQRNVYGIVDSFTEKSAYEQHAYNPAVTIKALKRDFPKAAKPILGPLARYARAVKNFGGSEQDYSFDENEAMRIKDSDKQFLAYAGVVGQKLDAQKPIVKGYMTSVADVARGIDVFKRSSSKAQRQMGRAVETTFGVMQRSEPESLQYAKEQHAVEQRLKAGYQRMSASLDKIMERL